ncbi:MAG: hypothetical protein AAGC60_07420 [Acidobacteriota bacterium]
MIEQIEVVVVWGDREIDRKIRRKIRGSELHGAVRRVQCHDAQPALLRCQVDPRRVCSRRDKRDLVKPRRILNRYLDRIEERNEAGRRIPAPARQVVPFGANEQNVGLGQEQGTSTFERRSSPAAPVDHLDLDQGVVDDLEHSEAVLVVPFAEFVDLWPGERVDEPTVVGDHRALEPRIDSRRHVEAFQEAEWIGLRARRGKR